MLKKKKKTSIDSAAVSTTTCVHSRLALARVYLVRIAASHEAVTES